jgi:hypothetical protein
MPSFGLAALVRALFVWLLIMLTESAQGALRRLLLDPDTAFALRQVSVLVGALIVFLVAWACGRWMRLPSIAAALSVGGLWVVLTLAFEIGLGRATGLTWREIGADYDLAHGGLMPLGLLAMALTPWAVRRLEIRQPILGRQDGEKRTTARAAASDK